MSLALFALFTAAFAIGSSEFVIAGILPAVSTDLSISIPTAGLLVSLYALGVAVGGPLLATFTSRFPRKTLKAGYYVYGLRLVSTMNPGRTKLFASASFRVGPATPAKKKTKPKSRKKKT